MSNGRERLRHVCVHFIEQSDGEWQVDVTGISANNLPITTGDGSDITVHLPMVSEKHGYFGIRDLTVKIAGAVRKPTKQEMPSS